MRLQNFPLTTAETGLLLAVGRLQLLERTYILVVDTLKL